MESKWRTFSLPARFLVVRGLFKIYATEHNLLSWTLEFDRAQTRCGVTRYAISRIQLSRIFIGSATTTFAQVKNILLHEIAHALTPGAKHGARWVRKAVSIGCDGKRCGAAFATPRWTLGCSKGCYKRRRFIRTKLNPHRVCAKCRGALEYYRSIKV